jgi:hypothetical protein
VKLDVYRSCSRQEKRDVLGAFWHPHTEATPRIHQAAIQYGPYAVLCLVAMVAELALVIYVTIGRAVVVGSLAVAVEALVLLSLWWAVVRWRALGRQLLH